MNGKVVKYIDYDTFSVLNDTLPTTADHGSGCSLPLVDRANLPVGCAQLRPRGSRIRRCRWAMLPGIAGNSGRATWRT